MHLKPPIPKCACIMATTSLLGPVPHFTHTLSYDVCMVIMFLTLCSCMHHAYTDMQYNVFTGGSSVRASFLSMHSYEVNMYNNIDGFFFTLNGSTDFSLHL